MNESNSAAPTTTNAPKQKTCEACGAQFPCFSNGGGCWCEELKVSQQTLADLRARHTDCLCPACLAKATKQAIPAI